MRLSFKMKLYTLFLTISLFAERFFFLIIIYKMKFFGYILILLVVFLNSIFALINALIRQRKNLRSLHH